MSRITKKTYQLANTLHWGMVHGMMRAFGQLTPDQPTEPDEKTRVLRARLIMEEALELIQKGLGVEVSLVGGGEDWIEALHTDPTVPLQFDRLSFEAKGKFDFIETADGCADLSVVNTGTLVACGLPDEELLAVVDDNNLAKVRNGRTDEFGKFQKHPDHQPPDIAGWLQRVRERTGGAA
jgi:predicted HAD superfamily Cof-like phosphohydrolase